MRCGVGMDERKGKKIKRNVKKKIGYKRNEEGEMLKKKKKLKQKMEQRKKRRC